MKNTRQNETTPTPRSLDDASDIEEAFLRGLRPEPRPHEDENGGQPHPDSL